jgi:hypothetical protein
MALPTFRFSGRIYPKAGDESYECPALSTVAVTCRCSPLLLSPLLSAELGRHDARDGPMYYSISAQLQGGGAVSCQLKVDGKVISSSSSTASGGYNIAQCEISQDPLSGNWTDTNTS